MSPSRFSKDKSLVNCDACEYVSGGFSCGHLIISCDGCSEDEEVLFDVISDILCQGIQWFSCARL